jgi:hypothetical protein
MLYLKPAHYGHCMRGIVYAEDRFIKIQAVASRGRIRHKVCDRGRNARYVVRWMEAGDKLFATLLNFASR